MVWAEHLSSSTHRGCYSLNLKHVRKQYSSMSHTVHGHTLLFQVRLIHKNKMIAVMFISPEKSCNSFPLHTQSVAQYFFLQTTADLDYCCSCIYVFFLATLKAKLLPWIPSLWFKDTPVSISNFLSGFSHDIETCFDLWLNTCRSFPSACASVQPHTGGSSHLTIFENEKTHKLSYKNVCDFLSVRTGFSTSCRVFHNKHLHPSFVHLSPCPYRDLDRMLICHIETNSHSWAVWVVHHENFSCSFLWPSELHCLSLCPVLSCPQPAPSSLGFHEDISPLQSTS